MNEIEVQDKISSLESKVQALTKRVEDLELDIDQPKATVSFFNDAAVDRLKNRLVDYIHEKPLQSMVIAILATAFIILLLK